MKTTINLIYLKFHKNETGYQTIQTGEFELTTGKTYVLSFKIKLDVALTSGDGVSYGYRVIFGSETNCGSTNVEFYTQVNLEVGVLTEITIEFEAKADTRNTIFGHLIKLSQKLKYLMCL